MDRLALLFPKTVPVPRFAPTQVEKELDVALGPEAPNARSR
jgi:hypothetical protein